MYDLDVTISGRVAEAFADVDARDVRGKRGLVHRSTLIAACQRQWESPHRDGDGDDPRGHQCHQYGRPVHLPDGSPGGLGDRWRGSARQRLDHRVLEPGAGRCPRPPRPSQLKGDNHPRPHPRWQPPSPNRHGMKLHIGISDRRHGIELTVAESPRCPDSTCARKIQPK